MTFNAGVHLQKNEKVRAKRAVHASAVGCNPLLAGSLKPHALFA